MKTLYVGKTKDVWLMDDGNVLLKFKDAVTGVGDTPDPGANQVIGLVPGKGSSSYRLSLLFFGLMEKAGIKTHMLHPGPEPNSMVVRRAIPFGDGLEVVCREKAWGSFIRRYGRYIAQGHPLPSLVEFTLKDDGRGDPPLTEDTICVLGIAGSDQVAHMKETAKKMTAIIKDYLNQRDIDLIDVKYEFGTTGSETLVMDEISGDSMRAARDGKILSQNELVAALLGDQ